MKIRSLFGASVLAVVAISVGYLASAPPRAAQAQVSNVQTGTLTASCSADPCAAGSTVSIQVPSGNGVCSANVYGTFGLIWTSEVSGSLTPATGSFQPQLLVPTNGGIAIGGGRLAFAGSFAAQAQSYFRVRATFYASGTANVILACVGAPLAAPPAPPAPAYSASPTPGASPT